MSKYGLFFKKHESFIQDSKKSESIYAIKANTKSEAIDFFSKIKKIDRDVLLEIFYVEEIK